MNRITISLEREIEDELRKIQGGLISNTRKDISFNTIINMMLLSGILSTSDFTDDTLEQLQKFIDGEKNDLSLDKQIDKFINKIK